MSTKQIVVQKKINAPLKKGPTPRTRGKNTNRRNRRRPMIENYQGGPLSRVQQFKLSKCAHDYLRALTDPFSNTIDAPCIPDLHDVPSWKIRTLQRGIFTVGTNGVGYLIVSPKSQSNNFASAVVQLLFMQAP